MVVEAESLAITDGGTLRKPRYDLDNLGEENERLQQLIQGRPYVKELLVELRDFDSATFDHSIDVARGFSSFVSERAVEDNFSQDDVDIAALAGLLHDYGKRLLGKEGKEIVSSSNPLTPDQRKLIQAHPRLAFDHIKAVAALHKDLLLDEAANILVAHHEFQPDPYPRDPQKSDLRRQRNTKREKMQLYLTAFDQAVSLAQGGEGGHAYMASNATADIVRQRLVVDRKGSPTTFFNNIATPVVQMLMKLGVTR